MGTVEFVSIAFSSLLRGIQYWVPFLYEVIGASGESNEKPEAVGLGNIPLQSVRFTPSLTVPICSVTATTAAEQFYLREVVACLMKTILFLTPKELRKNEEKLQPQVEGLLGQLVAAKRA